MAEEEAEPNQLRWGYKGTNIGPISNLSSECERGRDAARAEGHRGDAVVLDRGHEGASPGDPTGAVPAPGPWNDWRQS